MSTSKLNELISLMNDLVLECKLDVNTALKDVLMDVEPNLKMKYANAIKDHFSNFKKVA